MQSIGRGAAMRAYGIPLALALGLAGCGSVPSELADPNDPYENAPAPEAGETLSADIPEGYEFKGILYVPADEIPEEFRDQFAALPNDPMLGPPEAEAVPPADGIAASPSTKPEILPAPAATEAPADPAAIEPAEVPAVAGPIPAPSLASPFSEWDCTPANGIFTCRAPEPASADPRSLPAPDPEASGEAATPPAEGEAAFEIATEAPSTDGQWLGGPTPLLSPGTPFSAWACTSSNGMLTCTEPSNAP